MTLSEGKNLFYLGCMQVHSNAEDDHNDDVALAITHLIITSLAAYSCIVTELLDAPSC